MKKIIWKYNLKFCENKIIFHGILVLNISVDHWSLQLTAFYSTIEFTDISDRSNVHTTILALVMALRLIAIALLASSQTHAAIHANEIKQLRTLGVGNNFKSQITHSIVFIWIANVGYCIIDWQLFLNAGPKNRQVASQDRTPVRCPAKCILVYLSVGGCLCVYTYPKGYQRQLRKGVVAFKHRKQMLMATPRPNAKNCSIHCPS